MTLMGIENFLNYIFPRHLLDETSSRSLQHWDTIPLRMGAASEDAAAEEEGSPLCGAIQHLSTVLCFTLKSGVSHFLLNCMDVDLGRTMVFQLFSYK